jgi:hypothetical protein
MPEVQLVYGRSRRWRRQKIAVWLALFLLVLALGMFVAGYARPWVEHRLYLRAQQRCLDYIAPKDQLVFEQGPGVRNRPLPPRFHTAWSYEGQPDGGHAIGFMPVPWEAITRDRPAMSGRGGTQPGVLFMRSRKTQSGVERLIVIALSCMPERDADACGNVQTSEYIGRTATSDLRSWITWTEETHFGLFLSPTDHLRVFAGQPDPQDSSRFTIPYELNGARGVIEGQFVDPVLDRHLSMGEDWCIELRVISGPAPDRNPHQP